MCTSVALVTRRMYDLIVSTLLASTRFAVCANQQTKTSFDVPDSVSERLMDAEWMTFPIKNRDRASAPKINRLLPQQRPCR